VREILPCHPGAIVAAASSETADPTAIIKLRAEFALKEVQYITCVGLTSELCWRDVGVSTSSSRAGSGLQAAWMMQRSQLEGRIQELEEGA
jgi:hypothetical protein